MKNPLLMADNTYAWKSESGRYFVRRFRLTPKLKKEVPEEHNWDGIAYYDIHSKERINLAEGECSNCKDIIRSLHCGHFVTCSCGESSVDTDRWEPERHRFIGKVRNIS